MPLSSESGIWKATLQYLFIPYSADTLHLLIYNYPGQVRSGAGTSTGNTEHDAGTIERLYTHIRTFIHT